MSKAWRQLTPYLVFNCLVFLQGALLFGIDTGSFGSLQALPSFLNSFGVDDGTGERILPPTRKAVMNSLPWIGKITGCFASDVLIERTGFKKTMYAVVGIQTLGLALEMTAQQWGQFTVGRIVTYFGVGIVENVVPAYNAETSPAALRGVLSGSIMLLTAVGNLWGAMMSEAYATSTTPEGWLIPTATQFVPALGILALVPFTPESPRWLILKGRRAAGKAVLDQIRPKQDVDSGATMIEAKALEKLIEESLQIDEASWKDLFRGNYLRRSWIAATLFVIQQTNGGQFVNSYAATFYVQEGMGSMAFTYTVIGQVVGIFGSAAGIFLFDTTGRRPLLIVGSAICALLLYLASSIGNVATMLVCFILLPAFTRISAANTAYVTGVEIGGVSMRKKTMAFATAVDVVAALLVTSMTPYLLPPMGPKIGYIFGSVAAFGVWWGYFYFPELKGRSLEEVDELFAANLPARAFESYQTHGAGRILAGLENEGEVVEDRSRDIEFEDVADPATRLIGTS